MTVVVVFVLLSTWCCVVTPPEAHQETNALVDMRQKVEGIARIALGNESASTFGGGPLVGINLGFGADILINLSDGDENYSLEELAAELTRIFTLHKSYPQLSRINVVMKRGKVIGRIIRIRETRLNLESDWFTLLERDVHITEWCGEYFSISDTVENLGDGKIQSLLASEDGLWNGYLSFKIRDLWNVNVDTFDIKGRDEILLKGGRSTLFYNPSTQEFSTGKGWNDEAKIVNVIPAQRQIHVRDRDTLWLLTVLDTQDPRSINRCAAYHAQKVSGV